MTSPSVMAVRAARAMREVPDLTDAVTELAQMRGWRVHHGRPAQTAKGYRTAVQGDVGYPDVVLAHCNVPVTIVAELKRYGLGRASAPTPEQQVWLNLLGRSPGVLAVCWTTLDWVLGDIDRALRDPLLALHQAKGQTA
jgi:hypothetical protein